MEGIISLEEIAIRMRKKRKELKDASNEMRRNEWK